MALYRFQTHPSGGGDLGRGGHPVPAAPSGRNWWSLQLLAVLWPDRWGALRVAFVLQQDGPIRSWPKGRGQTAARPSKMSRVSRLRAGGFAPSQWALGHRSVPGCLVPSPAGQEQVDSGRNVRAHGGGVGCGPWAGHVHRTGVLPGERLTVSKTRLTLGGAVPVGQHSPMSEYHMQRIRDRADTPDANNPRE